MKVPFVGPSAPSRSAKQDAQRSINCFLESSVESTRQSGLIGTPGLRLRTTFSSGPVRNCIRMGDYTYWVAGSSVYRVDQSYRKVELGTISTTTGQVGMAHNGSEVLIVDGESGWTATPTNLREITDEDFPFGVTQAISADSFFVVGGLENSGQFFTNELPGDGRTWNGLDFASAEGSPDPLIGLAMVSREPWLMGTESTEVWINTGNPDFIYERSPNVFPEVGCKAPASVLVMDNTVYWLGVTKGGGMFVYRAEGYSPKRISHHALEYAMSTYRTVEDAQAFTYQLEGHSFYVLSFPTGNATWVFDAATNEWHEWLWRDPETNHFHRHRAACAVYNGNVTLVGDRENGKVYELDMDRYNDAGDPIRRVRRTQTLTDEGVRLFFSELTVDMQTGVGLDTGQGSSPKLMLRYSNDGGNSWSNYIESDIGAAGNYGARAIFRRLGVGRDRVWEISMSDPVPFRVFQAYARVERGT